MSVDKLPNRVTKICEVAPCPTVPALNLVSDYLAEIEQTIVEQRERWLGLCLLASDPGKTHRIHVVHDFHQERRKWATDPRVPSVNVFAGWSVASFLQEP